MALVKDRQLVVPSLAVVNTVALALWVGWFLLQDVVPMRLGIGGPLWWVPPLVLLVLGCLGFVVLARMPREQRLQGRSAMFLAWASIYVLLPVGFYLLLVMLFAIGFD